MQEKINSIIIILKWLINETDVETVVLMSKGAVRPVDERFARTGAEAQTNRDSRQKA